LLSWSTDVLLLSNLKVYYCDYSLSLESYPESSEFNPHSILRSISLPCMLQVPLIISRVQSMKLLIFPSISFYFSFRSKYSPQHSLINTGSKWSNITHSAMLLTKVCHLARENILEPKPHRKTILGLWINS